MSNGLVSIEIQNYRSIANLKLELGSLNVFFGPNGVGKSTFLDTLFFLSDCLNKDVSEATATRNQGIGLLWEKASKGETIRITLETQTAEYETEFGFSNGRIDGDIAEQLRIKSNDLLPISRNIREQTAVIYDLFKANLTRINTNSWKMILPRYSQPPSIEEVSYINSLLNTLRFYLAREADLETLKRLGSQSTHHIILSERCQNLWSAIRNLHDRRVLDNRYETIIGYMQKSFPSFKALLIEQIGQAAVYGNLIEEGRKQPIPASNMSDGHIQMLINLTALFSEEKGKTSLILFDEPDTSLHPHAIAQFAEAVKLATQEWGRQVFIATHSPVLLSQFAPENIFTVAFDENRATVMQRVSEIENIKDLLDEYALGSLYMAEAVAPQSKTFSEV